MSENLIIIILIFYKFIDIFVKIIKNIIELIKLINKLKKITMYKSILKNLDPQKKLIEINKKLSEKYKKDVSILVFQGKIYLIDNESTNDIDIIEEIDINELLTK